MMKLMCDCGCGHPITEYDAGQMPVILQRGPLLVELRVMPAPSGSRPNIRPSCTRTAVAEGEIIFPLAGRAVEDASVNVPDKRVRSISAKLDQIGEVKLDRIEEDDDVAGRSGLITNGAAAGANGSNW